MEPEVSAEVERWLTANGWFPGRDIGEDAEKLISVRIEDFREQGHELAPLPAATRFIHTYGRLSLPYPKAPEIVLRMSPCIGYDGDAEDIIEVQQMVGSPLFPVAYETYENGIVLMDDRERFFYLHETGPYFIAEGVDETFAKRLAGAPMQDVEDRRA